MEQDGEILETSHHSGAQMATQVMGQNAKDPDPDEHILNPERLGDGHTDQALAEGKNSMGADHLHPLGNLDEE